MRPLMSFVCLSWVCVLLLLSPLSAQPSKAKAHPDVISQGMKIAVDDAVRRGIQWLKRKKIRDGSFRGGLTGSYPLGETALACLTLAACQEFRNGPVFQAGLGYLRQTYRRVRSEDGLVALKTYGVALTMMALVEAHRQPAPKIGSRRTGVRGDRFDLGKNDRELLQEMTEWLAGQAQSGSFSYPISEGGLGPDHSNTQFALLAFRAVNDAGIEVPGEIFLDAARHFLRAQEDRGPQVLRPGKMLRPGSRSLSYLPPGKARGFGYRKGAPATGSMTAAGVASLSVCREYLREKRPSAYTLSMDQKMERGIQDGIAWLAHHFAVDRLPDPEGFASSHQKGLYHYYYLYTLERACGLSGAVRVGDWSWYFEGARYLLEAQQRDGGWPERSDVSRERQADSVLLNTCFALLFLSRFSDPNRPITKSAGDNLNLAAASTLSDEEFDSFFMVAFIRYRSEGESGIKAASFRSLGGRVYSRLVDRLESKDRADRAAAIEILRRLSRKRFGFDPDAGEKERTEAIREWVKWAEENA